MIVNINLRLHTVSCLDVNAEHALSFHSSCHGGFRSYFTSLILGLRELRFRGLDVWYLSSRRRRNRAHWCVPKGAVALVSLIGGLI